MCVQILVREFNSLMAKKIAIIYMIPKLYFSE